MSMRNDLSKMNMQSDSKHINLDLIDYNPEQAEDHRRMVKTRKCQHDD